MEWQKDSSRQDGGRFRCVVNKGMCKVLCKGQYLIIQGYHYV